MIHENTQEQYFTKFFPRFKQTKPRPKLKLKKAKERNADMRGFRCWETRNEDTI